jgi:hypothetical protein
VSAFLHRAVISSWQDEWTNTQGNKLRAVKPSVRVWTSSFRSIRRDEVIRTRLRIGHTHLTSGHLLRDVPAPLCFNCDAPLTVAHIMVDCPRYGEARRTYQLHGALSDMLGDDHSTVSRVLAFVNAVGLATLI